MPYTDLSWRLLRPTEGFYFSEVQAPTRQPVRTFLPTGYEPNYPYPLLVFFHGHGSSEEQVLRLAPRLSRRNYVCISLRGPRLLGARQDGRCGYGWGRAGSWTCDTEDYVLRAIEQTRRSYHIHSERIYLAGFCEGAGLAYHMGLTFPERFAGVVALNGALPRVPGKPLLRLPDVRSLKVFIGHGIANSYVPMSTAERDYRLLQTAGLAASYHTYPANHRLHPDMLRDVNRWVMKRVLAEV
jgi:phospholipase/carboxylesterase